MEEQRGGRTTIKDIAERAGVSKGAVSYALNGRPGVSDETRARILVIADELGWYPNRAARALSAARADACGFVLARPARTIALEPFFMEFIAGVESELATRSIALTLQLVRDVREEIAVYQRWYGEHRVDGVLVVDLRLDDPRVDELVRLGLPAVVVGGPLENRVLPAVWHDEAAVVTEAIRYLAALGHTANRAYHGRRHVRAHAAAGRGVPSNGSRARARRRDGRDGLQRRERRPGDAHAALVYRRRQARSSSTATSSPSPGSGSPSRWASRCPTTSPSSDGTTP